MTELEIKAILESTKVGKAVKDSLINLGKKETKIVRSQKTKFLILKRVMISKSNNWKFAQSKHRKAKKKFTRNNFMETQKKKSTSYKRAL